MNYLGLILELAKGLTSLCIQISTRRILNKIVMDLKPKVTCCGNKDVHNSLIPELERRLPRESTEWRRSYGRPPKTVKLKAHFVRFSQDLLVDVCNLEMYQSASSLHRRPFLHIYWTDCQDPDEFKSTVKDGITDWMRRLKDKNIVDWMIVQVISQDSVRGSKPKIPIPRSSVFDKIKSDFGGKNSERIIQLWEPFKENPSPRTLESWQSLVVKLRHLLLLSLNRHLGKFEDQVRSLREKRTEPNWSFTTYFLLHEELSFVFEMLGLYEEALIQYDEIDALLTQLVINSHFGEPLDCIEVFMRDCKCCDGVSLEKGSQEYLRQQIKTEEANYVDLRNYLFSRQCKLLLKFKKNSPWEIAQRTLEFLHNLKHELAMETVKVLLPKGGASCFVFLTALEVLKACENEDNDTAMAFSLDFALLYQYAREKLDDLGSLCGLMPGSSPTETELQTVCMLQSSIGKMQGEDIESNVPAKRLHNALSSTRAFESLYLELTRMAIATYKNIGRARAANVLGMDLAHFCSYRGELERAEQLLCEAYKVYKHERWTLLATKCLVKLAQCQKQLRHMDQYASACSILACEQHLSSEERSHYTQELLQVMRETMDSEKVIIVRAEPLLRVQDVQIELMKGIGSVGESIIVKLKLLSSLEEEVSCRRISFSIQTNELKRVGSIRSSKRMRATSPPDVEDGLSSAALSEEDLSDKPEGQPTEGEGFSDDVRETIPCPLVPKRPEIKSSEELSVLSANEDSEECCLQCFNVPLKHGVNEYNLTAQLAEEGHYYLKQLCVEIGRLDYVWPQLSLPGQSKGFAIVDDPPRINWSLPQELHLLAGLPQEVTLSISVEPGSIANGSVLEITSKKKGLIFEPISSGEAVINSSIDKQDISRTAPYSVRVPAIQDQEEDATDITVAMVTLPAVGPYAKIDFKLVFNASLEKQSAQEEVTEYLLTFNCKWLSPEVTADLSCSFHRPFTVRHVLHSSEISRFLQVLVSGINPVDLVIHSPDLIVTNCSSVKLTPLHRDSEYVIVDQQDMSFLWKIEGGEGSFTELDCEFRASFSPKQAEAKPSLLSSQQRRIFLYDFRIANTQTLYTISSKIESLEESCDLFAGSTYKWHITFTRLTSPPNESDPCQLLYDVDTDTNTWAVSGRKSGVVSIPRVSMATSDVVLNVIPQTGGHLAMPAIKLMKYLDKDEQLPEKDLDAPAKLNASGTRESRDVPLVLPFSCGQVYNKSLAVRVCVLPNNNTDQH